MFNLENKITWKELAPSLQAMFKTLQSQITDVKNEVNNINISLGDINKSITQINQTIENNYNELKGDITNIENNIEEITNVTNNITGMFATGEQGQVVKIDAENNGLFSDDNFRQLRCTYDSDTFEKEKNFKIDMKYIFNSYNRFTHSNKTNMEYLGYNYEPGWSNYYDFKDGQNRTDDQSVDVRNKWTYNKDSNYIASNFNATIVSGFYSPEKYNDWYIECMCTQQLMDYTVDKKMDDDPFGIIIGIITDSSGIQHTLILLRSNGFENQNALLYSLVYDIGNSTYKIVSNNTTPPRESSSGTSNNQVRLYCHKDSKNLRLNMKTSRFGLNPAFNGTYDWTYTLPSAKPSTWSQEMYDNIKNIMSNPQPIGYCVISNDCHFQILSSNIYNDIYIYRLDTDEKYEYQSGVYNKVGTASADLPYRIILYNANQDLLFYYYYKNRYNRITLDGGG